MQTEAGNGGRSLFAGLAPSLHLASEVFTWPFLHKIFNSSIMFCSQNNVDRPVASSTAAVGCEGPVAEEPRSAILPKWE